MVAESLAAVSAFVSQVQTIKEAISSTVEARDSAAFNQKSIELTAQIISAHSLALSAQEAQAALVAKVDALESKIVELNDWDVKKVGYSLAEVSEGCFAYSANAATDGDAAKHYLCANCFEERQVRILQLERRQPGRAEVLICHQCSSEIYIEGGWRPEYGKRR